MKIHIDVIGILKEDFGSMPEQSYFIETIYGNGGVVVKDDVVSETSSLYSWMIGRKWGEVLKELIKSNSLRKYEIFLGEEYD